jgi:ParB family chromosome partitioning protein
MKKKKKLEKKKKVIEKTREKFLEEFVFKEPQKGQTLVFKMAPVDKMKVVEYQRKPSTFHVMRLVSSIEKVGFLVPLIGVERNGNYLILDGQHRLLAAQKLGLKELPVILVPEEVVQLMMNLNIEKELNIRERSYVSLRVYEDFLKTSPQMLESEPQISEAIEPIYFVTLGIGYESQERLRGKLFEGILKRCDFPLDQPLESAFKIRQERAQKILEANEIITEIAQKLKEMEKWHPFVYQQIMSYVNPIKKKREPQDFDEVFEKLFANLEEVRQNPEVILKEEGVEGMEGEI